MHLSLFYTFWFGRILPSSIWIFKDWNRMFNFVECVRYLAPWETNLNCIKVIKYPIEYKEKSTLFSFILSDACDIYIYTKNNTIVGQRNTEYLLSIVTFHFYLLF
jgi:hypothetical protein